MHQVFDEEPYVAVVLNELVKTVCASCFKEDAVECPSQCSKCLLIFYCGSACQEKDSRIHEVECGFLQIRGETPKPPVRMLARLLIRRMLGDHSSVRSANGRTFNDQMAHTDRQQQSYVNYCFNDIQSYVPWKIDRSEIALYIGKLNTNQYGIEDSNRKELGDALYLGASIFNHSCLPDLIWRFDGSKIIYESRIEGQTYDKTLTVSYIANGDSTESRKDRKAKLSSRYHFDCACKKCRAYK